MTHLWSLIKPSGFGISSLGSSATLAQPWHTRVVGRISTGVEYFSEMVNASAIIR